MKRLAAALPALVGVPPALPGSDAALLHELRVYQVELEAQNEALRATQVELEAARDRYLDLYESAPVGYLTLDGQLVVQRANRTAAQLFGVERAALLNVRFDRRVAPEQTDTWYLHALALLQGQRSGPLELTLLHGNGSRFVAQLDASVLAEPGAARQLRLTLSDITERKRAEIELRLAATAFEVQEGVMVTDPQGRIERVNSAFTRLTGYSAAEAIGQRPNLLRSGRHDAAFYTALWAALRATGNWEGEVINRRKGGDEYAQWLTINAVRNARQQTTHYVATMVDISQRKAREEEVMQLAFYDPLTGLPNRRLLKDRLQQAIAFSARSQRESALMFIDLDHFKDINDTLGHEVGDRVLEWVGQRLSRCVREGDTVARLGGDEFVLLLSADLSTQPEQAAAQARAVAEKVLVTLAEPCVLDDRSHRVGASIGVVLFHDAGDSVSELLRRADLAMYQAKAAGRQTLRFFDAGAGQALQQRTELEAELGVAVVRDELVLHYQPVVDASGRVHGAEALVRWQHPRLGLLGPDEFIPIAEDRGLIHALGRWVLERACSQLARWAADPALAGLSVAVNVSARELRHPQFIDSVLTVLARSGANPRRLKLELTETVLLDNLDDTVVKMDRLRALGVRFALDDFGTGYASMTYLRRLPLDELKIDRSFVQGVLDGGMDATIARSLLDLGRNLGVPVVAEGVETAAQHAMLLASGCTAFQGYLFGRPGPVEPFEAAARG